MVCGALNVPSSSAALYRRIPIVIVGVHGVADELSVVGGVEWRWRTMCGIPLVAPRCALPPRRSFGMASALALGLALAAVKVDVGPLVANVIGGFHVEAWAVESDHHPVLLYQDEPLFEERGSGLLSPDWRRRL